MSKTLDEAVVIPYVMKFVEFTEEFPNDLSPMVSQLLEMDSQLRHQIDKIERKMLKLTESANIKHKKHHLASIEKHMKRVKKISEKKLEISAKMKELIENKGEKLTEHYEGLLLSNQTESFTYGTRSGKVWTG